MRRFGYGSAIMVLAMTCLASGLGAAEAAPAKRAAALDSPLVSSAFVEAADGGIKHRFTGLVCPASLAGIKQAAVVVGNSQATAGNARCIYGLSTDALSFTINLTPLKPGETAEALAKDYDLGPGLPVASTLLPIGQPGGPQAGRTIAPPKVGSSVLVATRDGWALTFTTGYSQAHLAEAKAVATDIFKAFQAAKP